MTKANAGMQDFSSWNGEPFFTEGPPEERVVYILRVGDEGAFRAFGTLESAPRILFEVRGTTEDELQRFTAQMKVEGARVKFGAPPFDTNTGGDKPTSGTKPGRK
ncbi:MAG TPA: hypothetical protein VK447_12615 [Myxococcaceae bacterium]|nr:hypothetical protein [Myxococcaceae bacterium]